MSSELLDLTTQDSSGSVNTGLDIAAIILTLLVILIILVLIVLFIMICRNKSRKLTTKDQGFGMQLYIAASIATSLQGIISYL